MQSETTKFTPGPWKASAHTVDPRRIATGITQYISVTALGGSRPVANVYVRPPIPEHEANARLIAACPTMFEALDDARPHLRSLLDNHYDGGRIVLYAADIDALEARLGDIQAAIAKALGS